MSKSSEQAADRTDGMPQVKEWLKDDACDVKAERDHETESNCSNAPHTSVDHDALLEAKLKAAELRVEKRMFKQITELKRIQLEIDIAKAEARCEVYDAMYLGENTDRGDVRNSSEPHGDRDESDAMRALVMGPSASAVPSPSELPMSTAAHLPYTVTTDSTNIPLVSTSEVRQPTQPQQTSELSTAQDYGVKESEERTQRAHSITTSQGKLERKSKQPEVTNDVIVELLSVQRQLASTLHLPSPKVHVFDGNPMEYPVFIRSFEMRIDSYLVNEADKLYYLDQHVTGEPKELISGCLFMTPDDGYKRARRLLDREYGDKFRIATGHVNKLHSWPRIGDHDPKAMKRLAIYMSKCLCAMEGINDLSVLDHTPNLQSIVRILPDEIQQEWREHVQDLRMDGRQVAFRELATFIEYVSERWNHPVFGQEALALVPDYSACAPQEQCFSTCVVSVVKCPLCESEHDLEECNEFMNKTLDEKRSFLMAKYICFSCFGSNHQSRDCTNKRTCNKCKRQHPTAMHDSNFRRRT
jgi:hypothetical protein